MTLRNMKRYRKKPVVITACQWFKNGDHYSDGDPKTEGETVRYYRTPDATCDSKCRVCGVRLFAHGWIDTLEGGLRVCPGDFIIEGIEGEYYPCKPDIFYATYEDV